MENFMFLKLFLEILLSESDYVAQHIQKWHKIQRTWPL